MCAAAWSLPALRGQAEGNSLVEEDNHDFTPMWNL